MGHQEDCGPLDARVEIGITWCVVCSKLQLSQLSGRWSGPSHEHWVGGDRTFAEVPFDEWADDRLLTLIRNACWEARELSLAVDDMRGLRLF